MDQPIQDAGVGLDLARALGLKGGVRLSISDVISPVYVVGQNEETPGSAVTSTVFIPADALLSSWAILQPQERVLVDRVSWRVQGSPAVVIMRVVEISASSGISTAQTGSGVFMDGRYPFDVSGSLLCWQGDSAVAAPSGVEIRRTFNQSEQIDFTTPLEIGITDDPNVKRALLVATNNSNRDFYVSSEHRVVPSGSLANR